jgi:hypothetical protein
MSCCSVLDSTEDVGEVFCEHHEDVLLKHLDGTFTGLQIKTRDSDQEVWKTGAVQLRAAFVRFAKLEAEFPGQFRAFRFLTNHPLFAGKNGQDVCHVLALIREAAGHLGLDQRAKKFLKRIAKEAGCPDDTAFAALSKSTATDDLPHKKDIETRLIAAIEPVWERAAHCSLSAVARAAKELITECANASSLAHEGLLPAYLPFLREDVELVGRIDGKRLDRLRIVAVLERGMNTMAQLDADPASCPTPGIGSTALLTAKLDAGGFSAVSVNSAEDLRNKADYLGIVWTKKHGSTQGLQRYTHIRSLVLRDAADAFEIALRPDGKFGVVMLSEFRKRLSVRRAEKREQLFDCSDEHLEGFAFSLTSECKVVWSVDRPWETKA